MRKKYLCVVVLSVFAISNFISHDLCALRYEVVPLVSNLPNVAPNVDLNLVNPWGLFFLEWQCVGG